MSIKFIVAFALFAALGMTACSTAAAVDRNVELSAESRNLVIYYDGANQNSKQRVVDTATQKQVEVVYLLDRLHSVVVRVPAGKPITEAIALFNGLPGVLMVNRDQTKHIQGP